MLLLPAGACRVLDQQTEENLTSLLVFTSGKRPVLHSAKPSLLQTLYCEQVMN